MERLTEVPFLRSLPNVEMAKLVPLAERRTLDAGVIFPGNASPSREIYFIVSGAAELVISHGDDEVPIMMLGPGDSVGPLLPDTSPHEERIRTEQPVELISIPAEHFHNLCWQYPKVYSMVAQYLSERSAIVYRELARTKQMLLTYAQELWDMHDQTPRSTDGMEDAAAAYDASSPLPAHSRESLGNWPFDQLSLPLNRKALLGAGMFLLLLILHLASRGLSLPKEAVVLLILGWGAINWYLSIIPDYAVALTMMAAAATASVAPLQTVLSGFTNPAYFLLVGIYGIGAAIQRTGLLYRFALFMLRRLPATYGGQTVALSLTGVLLTPILPSANGRVTIAAPLVKELTEAMRLQPGSPGRAGLFLSALHGFGQMYFLFMSGGTCLLLWGMLPEPFQSQTTWLRWLLLSLPLGLACFAGFVVLLLRMKGVREIPPVSRAILDAQLSTLGPVSPKEWITLFTSAGVFLLFATQPLHGISSAWPAVMGMVLLLTVGIIDRAAFLRNIDWSYLAFFGAVVGFAELIRYVHLDDLLGSLTQWLLAPVASSPVLFLTAIVLLTYAVRTVVPWSAAVPLMMLATTPMMLQYGYDPFIGGLAMLAASNPFILPNQNILYLNALSATGEETISTQMGTRYGWGHAVVVLLSVWVAVPIWGYLGLTP